MNLKPTYVTFEQAKWLKEKGFDVEVIKYWNGIGEYFEFKDYFNWNQADKFVSIPEQWQVVEWLRLNHRIWVDIACTVDITSFFYIIRGMRGLYVTGKNLNSPQEAYSAAINYTLKELI
jgi:hypothetical protein